MELCLYPDLLSTAPGLDPVQGGFRENRSTLDSALALHELCRQRTVDHHGEPPVLCFLDIKQAYDTVHRPVIWRGALETYMSDPMRSTAGTMSYLFNNAEELINFLKHFGILKTKADNRSCTFKLYIKKQILYIIVLFVILKISIRILLLK